MKRKITVAATCIILLLCGGCFPLGEAEQKLHAAIGPNLLNLQAVKEAIEEGADVNQPYDDSDSIYDYYPLDVALAQRAYPVCEELLDAGAEVNVVRDEAETYLQTACRSLDQRSCEMLLASKADINQKGGKSFAYTPLEALILDQRQTNQAQYLEMVDYLLDHGADVTAQTLQYCLKTENSHRYVVAKKILKIMEKQKIEISIDPALKYAILGDSKALKRQLVSEDIDVENSDILCFAAAYCDVDTIKTLLKQGFDITTVDQNNNTLLHLAAAYNTKEVVQYLLSQNMDLTIVNRLNENGDHIRYHYTPLTAAIISGQYENAECLMEQSSFLQISAESRKQNRTDVLAQAAIYGDEQTISFLMKHGYPKKEKLFENAIHCALTQDGRCETMKSLMEVCDDLGFQNVLSAISLDDLNPLNEDYIEQAKLLISRGRPVTAYALNRAIFAFNQEAVELYLSAGVDIHHEDKEGTTPLTAAIITGNLDLVKDFVNRGVDVNKTNVDGERPIVYASQHPSVEILQFLIEKEDEGGNL